MTPPNDSAAPAPTLLPTALRLPPQDIHPDELKVILAEAAERHAEAAEALAAAQDSFDAAERQREYAITEEQKLLEREDQARIEMLRKLFPTLVDDVARFKDRFYAVCAEEATNSQVIVEAFVVWARYHATVGLMRQTILRYDSERSREAWASWVHRISGWNELIRSVTSWRKGGVLQSEDDDLDGLAAVNARIVQESQAAPRPLHRDATDLSTPYVEALGLRDPAIAGIDLAFTAGDTPLEFGTEMSRAIIQGASSWASWAVSDMSDRARAEFRTEQNGAGE